MINNIFIFAHQDDEFGIFNKLEEKKDAYVFYLTSGYKTFIDPNTYSERDRESMSNLLKLGIKKNRIFFIGRKFNIPVYNLHKNLNNCYKFLKNFISQKKNKFQIFTHSWEGGNEDHDSCHILIKKLSLDTKKIVNAYDFSQYNNYKTGALPFHVQKHLSKNLIKTKLRLDQKIRYIKYLFKYKTQSYLWLPIYPSVIIKIIMNNYGNIAPISKIIRLKRPHEGKLLYEKLRKTKYTDINLYYKKFLKKNTN